MQYWKPNRLQPFKILNKLIQKGVKSHINNVLQALTLWGHFQIFQNYEARFKYCCAYIRTQLSTDTKSMLRYLSEAGVWQRGKGLLIYCIRVKQHWWVFMGFKRIPVEMIPTMKCSHHYKSKVGESRIHEKRKTKTSITNVHKVHVE